MASDTEDAFDWTEHVVASHGGDPAQALEALFGSTESRRDLVEQFQRIGLTISAEDYFLDEETRHELHLDDGVESIPCVADALQAAVLVDEEPVTVRSYDPVTDEPVTFVVTGDDVEVTPTDHVVSIGATPDLPDDEDMVSALGIEEFQECAYDDPQAHCQYINAFESVETYERWAAEVDAVTVALPAEPLLPEIRKFVASPVFE